MTADRISRTSLALFACIVVSSAVLIGARDVAAGGAEDPLFAGDALDPVTGRVAEILPGSPWLRPGPDGRFGSEDDVIDAVVVGDVDLVVRVGPVTITTAIPDPSPGRGAIPAVTAGLPGEGSALPFAVVASDGANPPSAGNPVVSNALEGNPALVFAFADLDGDGFVGVTLLDGDPADNVLEELELDPIARRFALFEGGQALGTIHLSVGGPPGAMPLVIVGASAYAGPRDPDFFAGLVADGPAVLTAMPFYPRTEPDRVIEGREPEPADPDELVGVQIEDHFTPDPVGIYGELFTLPTDGSRVTVDLARAQSGTVAGFGLARPALAAVYDPSSGGALRPGLAMSGERILLERLDGPFIDSSTAGASLRVVALDRLGNVAAPTRPETVMLLASNGLVITSPDTDGEPTRERIEVGDARGQVVALSGAGELLVEGLPEPSAGAAACAVLFALHWLRGRRSL